MLSSAPSAHRCRRAFIPVNSEAVVSTTSASSAPRSRAGDMKPNRQSAGLETHARPCRISAAPAGPSIVIGSHAPHPIASASARERRLTSGSGAGRSPMPDASAALPMSISMAATDMGSRVRDMAVPSAPDTRLTSWRSRMVIASGCSKDTWAWGSAHRIPCARDTEASVRGRRTVTSAGAKARFSRETCSRSPSRVATASTAGTTPR